LKRHRQTMGGLWEPWSQARMWACLVIVDLPIFHDPSKVTFTEPNLEIQTAPVQAAFRNR